MTCISYAYVTPPKKYEEYTRMDLYAVLMAQFVQATGKQKKEIDAVMVTGHSLGMAEEQIIDVLQIHPRHCAAFDVGGATASFMLKEAMTLIDQGFIQNALLFGTGKFDAFNREVALRNTAHPDFEAPYGPSIPSFYALYAQKYMATFGLKEEELAIVPVATRKWANLNPAAIMYKKPLTAADVLASPTIASPFHRFDCSIPLSGGGIIFVEKKNTLGTPSILLLGYGEAHNYGYITTNTSFTETAAVHSGKQAFAEANLAPSDIQLLEIYDAFSICPIILLEDLGFYEKGKAIAFFHEKRGEPGGNLPLNTYGGLMSCGHCGMPAGFFPLTEAVHQLQKNAGERQLNDISHALVHSYGGMFANHITAILGREKDV